MIRSMAGARAKSVVSVLFCLMFVAASGSADLSSIQKVLPSTLVIPQGNYVQQMLLGIGFQFYAYNGTTWVNNNVSADLYNFEGNKVVHHYFLGEEDSNGGQATWETYGTYQTPSSRVTGKRMDGVWQQDSINWLLLEATSHRGQKFFGLTSFVQRLYTQHGLPPSAEVSANIGDVFKSNYTAVYTFYAKET